MEEQLVHPESTQPADAPSAPPSPPTPSATSTPPPPVPTPPVPESAAPAANPLSVPAETLPVPPPAAASNPPAPSKHGGRLMHLVLAVVFGVAVVGAAAGVGYWFGKSSAKVATEQPKQSTVASKELTVPKGATIIAQCAVGRGTQYVLPDDIPHGPVYNVWQNKVIGIEYMFGKDELLSQNKHYLNLPLHGVQYDHINIGLLSQGHAGFPQPHYHVDVFTVPDTTAKSITCK